MSLLDITKTLKPKRRPVDNIERQKRRERALRQWADPQRRAALIARQRAAKTRVGYKEKLSASLRIFHDSPERGLKTRAEALRNRIAKMQKQLAEWDIMLGNG